MKMIKTALQTTRVLPLLNGVVFVAMITLPSSVSVATDIFEIFGPYSEMVIDDVPRFVVISFYVYPPNGGTTVCVV